MEKTIQILYDKNLFEKFDNTDEGLGDYLFRENSEDTEVEAMGSEPQKQIYE